MLGHDVSPLNPPSLIRRMPVTARGSAPSLVYRRWLVERPSTPSHSGCLAQCPELYWVWLPLLYFKDIYLSLKRQYGAYQHQHKCILFILYFSQYSRREDKCLYYSCDVFSQQHLQYSFTHKMHNLISLLLFQITVFFLLCGTLLELQNWLRPPLLSYAPSGYRHHRMDGRG